MPRLLRVSLLRATPLLFPLSILVGCAMAPPVDDSRSTTLEVRLHRVSSQARVVLPLAPLPLVARDPSAPKAWGSLSTEGFETPDRSPRDLLGKDLALEIPPSAHLDLGLRLGRSWLLETSLDGTSEGLEGAWAGVGKGFALRGAELTLRAAGGAQIVEAANLYDVNVRRIRCLPDSCVVEDLNPTTFTDRTRTWEAASRLAASLQPSASGPWIDAQWIGPMAFARWVPLRSTTTTGETNSASSVASMSFHTLGGGWVFRGNRGQLVLGLRYLWGFRAVGFTVQTTTGFLSRTPRRRGTDGTSSDSARRFPRCPAGA